MSDELETMINKPLDPAPALPEGTAPLDKYAADRKEMFLAADGSMMCEAHPGREWPHDDCAGPGMPWVVKGRTLIEELLSSSALVPQKADDGDDPRWRAKVDFAVLCLRNSGIDVECGACMEVAFTGVTTNTHDCKSVPQEEIARLTQELDRVVTEVRALDGGWFSDPSSGLRPSEMVMNLGLEYVARQRAIEAAEARASAAEALAERLKLEAQYHAQEARAQRATVHECYQAVGAKVGDWHGAEPVKAFVAAAEAAGIALRAQLETLQTFAREVLDGYRTGEVGDIDGGWLQDRALELGLLVEGTADDDPNFYLSTVLGVIEPRPQQTKDEEHKEDTRVGRSPS